MVTYRINGYSVPKIQAVKLLRSLSASTHYRTMGLKEAKELLDRVDAGEEPTFEGDLHPGVRLAYARRDGLDIEIVQEPVVKHRLTVFLKDFPLGVDNPQEFINPQQSLYQEGVLRVSYEEEVYTIPIHNILYSFYSKEGE